MTSGGSAPAGHSESWDAIFQHWGIGAYDFGIAPFPLSAKQIGEACQHFTRPGQKEVRILCKQDTRESRPAIFKEKDLFILPVRNGQFVLVKGEGYMDIPPILSPLKNYTSDFPFQLDTTIAGDSEMQHLDNAYALSLIRHFMNDPSLVLTIRGRKYTPLFNFVVGEFSIQAKGVQTEVDGGYEGERQVVLVEAKKEGADNTIIRQLYYPFRQWSTHTEKPIATVFFQHTDNDEFHLWQFGFANPDDYNSVYLVKSGRYRITRRP